MRKRILVLFCCLGLVAGSVCADLVATRAPANILVALVFKVLAYDRNLGQRAGDVLNIGFVCNTSDADKADYSALRSDILREMSGLGDDFRVAGLPVKFGIFLFDAGASGEGELERLVGRESLDVLVSLDGSREGCRSVARVARRTKTASIGSTHVFLETGGAFAILLAEGKPRLFVNIEAARSAGSDYGSKLLNSCSAVSYGPS